MVKHSIMRSTFILAVATCLIQINKGAIITTENEGMYRYIQSKIICLSWASSEHCNPVQGQYRVFPV